MENSDEDLDGNVEDRTAFWERIAWTIPRRTFHERSFQRTCRLSSMSVADHGAGRVYGRTSLVGTLGERFVESDFWIRGG